MLCKDIQNLSTSYQTSRLEAFHSVVIQFAPISGYEIKVNQYYVVYCAVLTYTSTSRLLLATLHYNNNSSKQQAVTKAGEE